MSQDEIKLHRYQPHPKTIGLRTSSYRNDHTRHVSEQLYLRSEAEPWSVSDILAHLRAYSDVWDHSIIARLRRITLRYVSPRSWMRKPPYADQEFDTALAAFTQERGKLVETLADLDEAGWARQGTFTGT